MWNIRSHACRFPVHTGTLTPSIAHPNRFLNHLKRFSAGFLTFRGGKTKNRMVLGAESTIWNARRVCFTHYQRKNYFYFGATERLRALRCSIFTGGVVTASSRCLACFRWKRRCGGKLASPLSQALSGLPALPKGEPLAWRQSFWADRKACGSACSHLGELSRSD